jgi:hypothetical protein
MQQSPNQLPLLNNAIQNNDNYRQLITLFRQFVPHLNGAWVIRCPLELLLNLNPTQDQLLGIVARVNNNQQIQMLQQIPLDIWQVFLNNSIEIIQFHILASELEADPIAEHALRYTLKALFSLINSYIAGHLVPEELRPELTAMRNYYAHSNPYVDKSMAKPAEFLIRYSSIFTKRVLAPMFGDPPWNGPQLNLVP